MTSDKDILADEPPMWVKIAVCIAVVGVMSAVRLGAFSHRVMPIAFGMPLIVFVWLRDRKLLWITAAIFALVTIIKYTFVLPVIDETGTPISVNERVVDAGLVLLDLFVITIVLHILIGRTKALRHRNVELASTNEELSAREEEIQRQNEELQSTAEELERQSEELRVSNEDLAQRERMTETLLDLSRSLHVGLDGDATLSRICETLGQLVNGPTVATAILLNEDGGVKVRCHYGFGPAGLKSDFIPGVRAFASLVLEQGRTGYLEDLSLRPDLEVPQPKAGDPMFSVLATPLVVRGKAVGTIELYSRERKHWSEEQTALIESLAAQTSISLENAQLFQELDSGRRRLATIIEQVPVGISVASPDLSDMRLNAAGAAIMGEAPDANIASYIQRAPWQVYADGKPLAPESYPIVRALRGERVYPHEIETIMHSGRRVTLLVSAAAFNDADGKIMGAVSTFVDITQLKQLQRELETRRREAEEASVRKTRFLAAASHDIRTPANAISLLAELLKRTADNPSLAGDIPQLAEELRVSATSLVNLVSNILDVTRFDTDKLDLHETEFSLAQLLEEEVRQVLPLAQAKRLILDNNSAPKNLWIRADRIKLGRVIGNLLGNAIKFTDSGGIKVTSGRDGDGTIEIAVTDTGIGISEENQAHIFDEFWQLSDPQRSKGSGLGLAISKRLIEAMGGNVKVCSTTGKGSTFTVGLPKSAAVAPRIRRFAVVNFRIHTAGDWSPGQIRIAWTASTRRLDLAVEEQIGRAWNEAKARLGDKLFDGPLCRLEAWSASPASLDLTLSHTSYRPFLGTNLTNAAALTPDVMANPVGMSTALETADGWLLLGRRNDSVAYHPNRVHPFAGSLEPSEKLDVFEEIRRELREELGMSAADIAELRCIGICEDLSLRQPELVFSARSSLSREQIERNLDPKEHVAIYAISTTQVRESASVEDPILTPVAAASLMLWKR